MRPQKIVVAVPLEDELLDPLYDWGSHFDFTNVESVHFVHIVKKTVTPLEFGLITTPDETIYQDMVPTLEKFLKDESRKILPKSFKGEVTFQLTRDFNPEEEIIDILKSKEANLVVVATRGKHGFEGLFHSSFTDYMVKFAPCDVFVVRPERKENKAA